ncbi:uncharacterized protein K460DRAFT_192948 [Cucurbitaria berberidis CBS 394.84]|uniref:Arrestin-like N-terminal domain-containing protein n=1 Tax=Cucurbitaria berberidis CBS 394.84 TaxID=1168544 RepID=A0A9P4L406_9PLEO|nr:uncharacterized protein K460DRAFT_192948 [Cucurbitaria berberidis CBS 394.84]KAF1840817.1 hypothetical protein K460DRAFT_192948 [Cucurbitaria berberidis CBS 394.84]
MTEPVLRVIVDGDSNKTYRKGELVTGRIILIVEEQEQIESLKVVFAGSCITKTSRPYRIYGNDDDVPPRRDYEEKIRLFNREIEIIPRSTLDPKKYSWTFEFTFPESTEQRYKRLIHGPNYLREPHPLPPTLQLKTNTPGGAAHISYFVQARLVFADSRGTKRCKHMLRYHPTPQGEVPREAKITSALLYGQRWKPAKEKENTRTAVDKVFLRRSSNSNPRILPSLWHPESIAPGQHIPLSISLVNTRDPFNEAKGECILDSLSVTISTYSTSMCGHHMTEPEDIVSKHVTCIARTSMNKSLPFGKMVSLTSNFRLVDDAECVPTFKTYTITRRYALTVSIGIKFNDQHFTVKSTTPLEILPRMPRELPSPLEDGDDVDPLPLYVPREPSKEFAPDYESIYALSRTTSSENSMALPPSRSSSLFSSASALSSAVSTPPSREVEQLVLERVEG